MRPLEGFAGVRVKLGRHQFPLLPKVQRGKGGMSGEGVVLLLLRLPPAPAGGKSVSGDRAAAVQKQQAPSWL